jgi:hypothetical protein
MRGVGIRIVALACVLMCVLPSCSETAGEATGKNAGTGALGGSGGAGGTSAGGAGGVGEAGRGADGSSGAAAGTTGSGGSVAGQFVHPGLLFTTANLERMRDNVAAQVEPYLSGWYRLRTDGHASLDYVPVPHAVVTRISDGSGVGDVDLKNDAAASFAHAVAWFISGDAAHAQKAVEILDAWSGTLTEIGGDTDRFLAAGLYGYPMANAAEILRATYPTWGAVEIGRLRTMLLTIFYPLNHEFLETHAGSRVDHHYANWDAAQIVSIISIGVFADDREKYDEAVDYFMNGPGNGNIMRAIYDGETGQLQESGRDQAHAQLSIGLLATMCETAWNQGDDLYGYDGNRLLKGFEYTASYLLGNDVPFKIYSDQSRTHTEISQLQREQRRPIYEMVYNHYTNRRGIAAPYTQELAEAIRPEGWHGDHPSFGTILFTRPYEGP